MHLRQQQANIDPKETDATKNADKEHQNAKHRIQFVISNNCVAVQKCQCQKTSFPERQLRLTKEGTASCFARKRKTTCIFLVILQSKMNLDEAELSLLAPNKCQLIQCTRQIFLNLV